GFNNIFALDLNVVNLDRIQAAVDRGALDVNNTVDVEALVRSRVLRRAQDGVRLLGRGGGKMALPFCVHCASKSAIEAGEKVGGAVKVLALPKSIETAA